jgi:steroid 5-alpha reductase family enzyme
MSVATQIAFAVALSIAMSLSWAIANRTRRSGWIDAIWSLAVGLGGLVGALLPLSNMTSRQLLVAALAAAWSLRLGMHIARRAHGGADDPRYSHLRREWGRDARRKLFWFLQAQAVVAWLLVFSVVVAAHRPTPRLDMLDLAGVVLFLVAILGETVADGQLRSFGRDETRKGRICDIGLWQYSRHPNYFFEWLVWVAFALMAIDIEGSYAWGLSALVGPALMYWLLVHVSGIPPLEAHMLRSRGVAFRDYQRRVNAFWPGPPRPLHTVDRETAK